MKSKPYIIIPNLIEQPTWGGKYIEKFKQLNFGALSKINIGQSYELYEYTNLSTKTSTEKDPSIELGHPSDPQASQQQSRNDQPFSLQSLIAQDPEAILGKKNLISKENKIQILIKFTQALGNSYQIHLKKKIKGVRWIPKPESWYYLEPGIVTLGVKSGSNWEKYRVTCDSIDNLSQNLSHKVRSGKIDLEDARDNLIQHINENNPEQFVNRVIINKNQLIDLSPCGIHHSWEEDESVAPLGNVVYEVQKNVLDDESTIRCFDKGKIKADGSIRNIQIKDYFKFIDRSQHTNNPKSHFRTSEPVVDNDNFKLYQIFQTKYYNVQELHLSGKTSNDFTRTENSFHHLFVREGSAIIETKQDHWTLTQGFSIFIPANTGQYEITPNKINQSVVLKTYM